MTKAHPQIAELTALELRQKIRVRKAAELNDIDEQTFRRHYGHLIRKIYCPECLRLATDMRDYMQEIVDHLEAQRQLANSEENTATDSEDA